MNKQIEYLVVEYDELCLPKDSAPKLRGFFASQNRNNVLLHQHIGTGVDYKYPLVQYKILSSHPVILAAEEGMSSVRELSASINEIVIDDKTYPINSCELSIYEKKLGDNEKTKHYKFLTPWFCLNQINYSRYIAGDEQEKKELLNRILVGNILSLSKRFGVAAEKRITTELDLEEQNIVFKGETMLGFTGEFSVNYSLPDYFGLGKSVSRGFGTIKCKEKAL